MTISTLARCAILLFLASALPSRALADAASAASRFFANLERLGYDTSLQRTSTVDERTLVDGVYRLEDKSTGELVGLITESSDVIGDSNGWRWIAEGGTRPLSEEELAQLRAEVLQNIQRQKLIKVTYGNGGARRIVLISAVNCPFCAKMEETLARRAASIDTTFYVVPISLSPSLNSEDGRASWHKAASLWCAADNAAAWRRFWATRQFIEASGCRLDEAAAFKTSRNFSTVLSSIGVRPHGTPAMIREDGVVLSFPAEPDARYFNDVLGSRALREINVPPAEIGRERWLVVSPPAAKRQ